MNHEPHTRDNKHGVVVMDQVRVRVDDEWRPWSTVMYSETEVYDYEKKRSHKKGFYLNPMFGRNIYLEEHDVENVEILKRWPDDFGAGKVQSSCQILSSNQNKA